jgi:hypothetical protein
VTEPALPALDLDGLEAAVFATDGRPRYDGVAGFLASRGIRLPLGDPSDPPDRETVRGNWGVNLHLTPDRLRVRVPASCTGTVRIGVKGEVVDLAPGSSREFPS